MLGAAHANGDGVIQDEAESVRWYRQATEQGDAPSQLLVGVAYATGQGVGKDDAEAVKWFRKSAEQGYDEAQTELGFMYATDTLTHLIHRHKTRDDESNDLQGTDIHFDLALTFHLQSVQIGL